MKRETVRAVHDADVEGLLASLGLLDDLKAGNMRCAICGEPVTLVNFGCLYPEDGVPRVCCDNTGCYERLLERRHRESDR